MFWRVIPEDVADAKTFLRFRSCPIMRESLFLVQTFASRFLPRLCSAVARQPNTF